MIDYDKYCLDEDDIDFLEELKEIFEEEESEQALVCGNDTFLVAPTEDGVEIWVDGEMVAKYSSVDEMFLNFQIDGKPLIERITEIDYYDEY